ncbi:MAG: threonine synthase [Candidatus Sumerlaeia bacterium]
MWKGVIEAYRSFLPVSAHTRIITLNEGQTPLIEAHALSEKLGGRARVFLKYEGTNPTGSFKDRGMTLAVTKAVEEGAEAVICASTGNTSASAAAYAARAGIQSIVLLPRGKIALGKLAQAQMYGAKVLAVDGNFDEALHLVRETAANFPVTIVNSINPYRLQGQKTGAFEICDQLGRAPDFHFIPVGNAGNISAYWMGYKEYFDHGIISRKPRMMGFQAAGAAPIVRGHPIANPETVATAIRIGNPASWKMAEAARDESGGLIEMVSDEQILDAYKFLSSYEGVFCEPASAASVAGLLMLNERGFFNETGAGEPLIIVCIITGHGLKDPNTATQNAPGVIEIPARLDAVAEHLSAACRKN